MDRVPAESYLQEIMSNLAFALINRQDEILFCSPRAIPFLEAQHIPPRTDILKAVHTLLQPPLSVALADSRHSDSTVAFCHHQPDDNGKQRRLLITIRPFQSPGMETGIRMILFDAVEPTEEEHSSVKAPNQNLVSDLYAELMRSRDEFHRLTRDNEETVNSLASLNEELYLINEELRITSDELKTNRHSLEAGNAPLVEMIFKINKANDDLENFVEATELALIFVDLDKRIIRFTAPARKVFRIQAGDVGRPVVDISHCLKYKTLEDDVKTVLARHEKVEREVQGMDGTWFCLRVIPYMSDDANAVGAIIILVDISLRKQAEENLRSGEQRWRAALEATGDGVWEWDIPSNTCSLSPAWRRILGYGPDEIVAGVLEEWQALIHADDRAEVAKDIEGCGNSEPGWFSHEYRIKCRDGHWKWVLSRGAVVERAHDGKAKRLIGTLSDISHKKMPSTRSGIAPIMIP